MTDIEKIKICNHSWTNHKIYEMLKCFHCSFISHNSYVCKSCGMPTINESVKCIKCGITLIEWSRKFLGFGTNQHSGTFFDERTTPGA